MAHMFVNVFKRFLCDFKWLCQNKGVTDNLNLSNEIFFTSHVLSTDTST